MELIWLVNVSIAMTKYRDFKIVIKALVLNIEWPDDATGISERSNRIILHLIFYFLVHF